MLDDASRAIARALEVFGVAVIVLGTIYASIASYKRLARRAEFSETYQWYRQSLGRAILLGLEFLVAADIIGTVSIDPTFNDLGILALIVLIRTFISFTLEVEISGRWPWQEELREPSGHNPESAVDETHH